MWSIIDARRSHIPRLASIIRDANQDVADRFNLTLQNAPSHPSNCVDAWVRTSMDKGVRYFLLKAAGRFRGCVALERARPQVFYLERLAVLPPDRRHGYGAALTEHAAQEAAKAGGKRLEIGIIAEHFELKQWYQKRGFKAGATKNFDHLPFGVLFMFLDLGDTRA